MKFLFDLLPVILFFIVFKWGESHTGDAQALAAQYLSALVSGGAPTPAQAPILLATAIAIVITLGQIGYQLVRGRKVDAMLWVSAAIIIVFGGATIYFHNETFIKWKPTVLYWFIATAFLVSQLVLKKNLVRGMMESQISLPDAVWQRLSVSYIFFFLVMGLLNLFVAYNFSTSIWVNFKLFGGMGLLLAFVVAQSIFLAKYVQDSK